MRLAIEGPAESKNASDKRICRQSSCDSAPQQSWRWLGQAERWEHLADAAFMLKPEALPAGQKRHGSQSIICLYGLEALLVRDARRGLVFRLRDIINTLFECIE